MTVVKLAKPAPKVDEPPPGYEVDETRPHVKITPDIGAVVDQAIQALAPAGIYQRSGTLVDIVREASMDDEGVVRPEGTPHIRMLPSARLRELLATAVKFTRVRKTQDGGYQTYATAPPSDVCAAVAARGQWAHIPPLSGIVEWPALRPDGTVIELAGYDAATALLYEPSAEVTVPRSPSQAEAKAAVATLLELVADFPIASDSHRSAWLCALLTVLARSAISGPTPLVLIDANERGAGKSLLADVVGLIVRGKRLPRRTAPEDPAEWKKAMLAIAIAADPVILIDNVTKTLKSDALDAVLTGTSFRERVLGRNEELELDIRTMFMATANNASISADLVRRSLHVRLEAQTERPEQRSGWAHPDLPGYIAAERGRYLTAGLTILRGYFAAGQPEVEMRPMGSFEAWSGVVRGAVIWAGLPDPVETQDALRDTADQEREVLHVLFAAWHAVHGERKVTARDVLGGLEFDPHFGMDPQSKMLRDAVCSFCDCEPGKLPSVRRFGNKLRQQRGRITDGIIFERGDDERKEQGFTWRTRKIG